jgi:hypothetical protein
MGTYVIGKAWQHSITLLFLALFITACGAPSDTLSSNAPGISPVVQVASSGKPPEKIMILPESIPLDNCNGSSEVSFTIQRSRAILHTLDLGAQIAVDARGSAGIPEFGQVQIGAEVATHYNVTYGEQETIARSLTIGARPGTNILHHIQQVEYWETGTVIISAAGHSVNLPYRFRTDFGVEFLNSERGTCPSDTNPPEPPPGQESVPTTQQNQPSPIASAPTVPVQQPPSQSTSQQSACPNINSLPAEDELSARRPQVIPPGCILIVEWYVTGYCELLITTTIPPLSANAHGHWWYVHPKQPDGPSGHIARFKARSDTSDCMVKDER